MRIVNDNIALDLIRRSNMSVNIAAKSPEDYRMDKLDKDKLELSMSGKSRGTTITSSAGKINTAGLIITGLMVSTLNGGGYPISLGSSTATVSNEKAALGASENRLGGNSPSIDKSYKKNLDYLESKNIGIDRAKEKLEQAKEDILDQAPKAALAQGNSSHRAVLHLLR